MNAQLTSQTGPQGTGHFPNFSTPMQRGTSPLECWYSGVVNQNAYTTATAQFNNLFAYPVTIGGSGFIDRIAFEVTTGVATSVGRCGIYRATSKFNIYPSERIVDGGEQDCSSAAIKSSTVSVFLAPGLYWFVIHTGVASPTVRAGSAAANSPISGVPATIGTSPNIGIFGASAYASLPATFPAGITGAPSVSRLVHVRFAS